MDVAANGQEETALLEGGSTLTRAMMERFRREDENVSKVTTSSPEAIERQAELDSLAP